MRAGLFPWGGKGAVEVLLGAGNGGAVLLLGALACFGGVTSVPFAFRAGTGGFDSRGCAGARGRAGQLCGRYAQGIVSALGEKKSWFETC